jgi:hypothetical protein
MLINEYYKDDVKPTNIIRMITFINKNSVVDVNQRIL